jgi:hypothetical protein
VYLLKFNVALMAFLNSLYALALGLMIVFLAESPDYPLGGQCPASTD